MKPTLQRHPAPVEDADRALLELGAVAGLAGLVLEVVMDQLHPGRADPNDSPAAFREYSVSSTWTYVHIGQFLGTVLIVLALVALARPLTRQRGLPGALATVATTTAVLAAAIFAVQMAVDGAALRDAVRMWVAASAGPEKTSAFQVAQGVRGVEKGLSGFFHLSNGLTLVALGLAMVAGSRYRRWMGWTAVASGCAFLVGGVVTARTGFSPAAGLWLTPGLLLLAVFLVSTSVSLWRGGPALSSTPA